jgi:hypothetical protein
MPVELMLNNVGEKLFTPAAVPKGGTGEDVLQLLKNCRFVNFVDGRASLGGIRVGN